MEANAEIDVDIGGVATVRIRGGRREAQQTAESLEARWSREVAPQLAAAKVADLDGLNAKIEEAQELDSSVKAKDAELQSLDVQIASLADSAQKLREALERANACHAALGDVPLATFASDLATLGTEPMRYLARAPATGVWRACAGARDSEPSRYGPYSRGRTNSESGAALNAAVAARDAALAAFPEGVAATLSAAQAALAAALDERRRPWPSSHRWKARCGAEERVEAAVSEARAAAEQAQARLDAAHAEQTKAITDHASQAGRLEELRRQRDAEDLPQPGIGSATRRIDMPPCRSLTDRNRGRSHGGAKCRNGREIRTARNPARDRADPRRTRASRRRRGARAAARCDRGVRVGGAAGAGDRG